MTAGQARTAKRLAALGGAFVLLVLGALWVEFKGTAEGDQGSISELAWIAWAAQPWAILLVSHLVAAPVWFFGGHFFAQRSSVYDQIREGDDHETRNRARAAEQMVGLLVEAGRDLAQARTTRDATQIQAARSHMDDLLTVATNTIGGTAR